MNFFAAGGTVGRSVVAPPGVTPAVLQTLRAAFHATTKDEQFLAEARKLQLDVEPLAGVELQNVAEKIVSTGPAERERVMAVAK